MPDEDRQGKMEFSSRDHIAVIRPQPNELNRTTKAIRIQRECLVPKGEGTEGCEGREEDLPVGPGTLNLRESVSSTNQDSPQIPQIAAD
jgi:hypothetical protein